MKFLLELDIPSESTDRAWLVKIALKSVARIMVSRTNATFGDFVETRDIKNSRGEQSGTWTVQP